MLGQSDENTMAIKERRQSKKGKKKGQQGEDKQYSIDIGPHMCKQTGIKQQFTD